MRLKLANAPVSWGVDYPDDPKNPPWEKVMTEIGEAGYRYTELGPYGYFPTEPDVLRAELQRRELTVVAGFIFQALNDPAQRETVLENAQRTISLLGQVGGQYLVTIDHISKERMATAGRGDQARRLDQSRLAQMVSLIDRIADLALASGVTPVIHQHAGCYIEFEDELETILGRLGDERVGICIDTGHMSYAGIDPVDFYRRHADRVRYLHFKDIDATVHERVIRDRIPFLSAVEQKVFCPLGRGVVNWQSLRDSLDEMDYVGFANIEQDIDPAISLRPIDDARASLAYLRSVGL